MKEAAESPVHARADAPLAVEIRGVTFAYPGAEQSEPTLSNVDLCIREHEFLGIIGPNGGGKTTLLKILLGLLEPQAGTVRVFGVPPHASRHRIGYVPQQARVDPTVPATALDIVLMGRLKTSSWGPSYRRADIDAARNALARTGTADLAERPLATLSGGQRQRVLIARALVADAQLLLLDEPTTGIDPRREEELFELLADLGNSMALVMVTHDISLALAHTHTVVSIDHTLSRVEGETVSPQLMARIYGGEFQRLEAAHGHDR